MTQDTLKKSNLPDSPGVYKFVDAKGKILYIGKATSLRDRVRSYFSNDLLHTRGKHIVDMVVTADAVSHILTESALEALILEAALIKKYQPVYNTKEKDDRSFNYVVITREDFPRVLVLRERVMLGGSDGAVQKYQYIFGPFPHGSALAEAVKIIRRILPFRDSCEPKVGIPCFNRQIGLCPGVCSNEMSKTEYRKRIQNIKLFFQGKKSLIMKKIEQDMHTHAKKHQFEEAGECKRMLFSLRHIRDVSLLDESIVNKSQQVSSRRRKPYRIEAYDIAHLAGTHIVGVMVVVEDGKRAPKEYRKFNITSSSTANDTLHLEEIVTRRLSHAEWKFPDLVVIDGGTAQRNRIKKLLDTLAFSIPVVSVVKDDRHKPKDILGLERYIDQYKKEILLANYESHRFAVTFHRKKRGVSLGLPKKVRREV